MSTKDKSQKSLSLAQHFDAPDDYVGHFAWLCGYSADALFLDDAAERFTRLTRLQRGRKGGITLAVFLDPGNPPVSLRDAPAIAHLPIMSHVNKPFRLLHAKVALLGFRHQENHQQWRLRLLVSTGNWTRQTLEESLDLVWRIDIDSESLNNKNLDVQRNCADIKAAWELMAWIKGHFDTRLLDASGHGRISETRHAMEQVIGWINACSAKAGGQPRIFDNRQYSLLSQLPDRIKLGSKVRRNYLAMGSGFYEGENNSEKPPEVPLAIISTLHREGLLTESAEVDLYVNPNACQAVASSLKALCEQGITVRSAATPVTVFGGRAERSLHAKFLFGANSRENSNTCTSPWVYLGSGNLTRPGFSQKMSPNDGNLEVGVVLAPDVLFWKPGKTAPHDRVVTNLLPIQWDDELDESNQLSAGPGMEPRDIEYLAPPVAWLEWHKSGGICELRVDADAAAEVDVLDSSGKLCERTKTGFHWAEAQPREVRIRWHSDGRELEALIPVMDQYGRIAATSLPAIDMDEAMWQLAAFPMPADDDAEGNLDLDDSPPENQGKGLNSASAATGGYPIRQMMELIESIAAKQTGIDEMDWPIWCNRLEQTLGQAADSAPVMHFRETLKLNPLSPLRHPSFRPSFAETGESEHGCLYDQTLHKIEERWKVNELSPLGGAQ